VDPRPATSAPARLITQGSSKGGALTGIAAIVVPAARWVYSTIIQLQIDGSGHAL